MFDVSSDTTTIRSARLRVALVLPVGGSLLASAEFGHALSSCQFLEVVEVAEIEARHVKHPVTVVMRFLRWLDTLRQRNGGGLCAPSAIAELLTPGRPVIKASSPGNLKLNCDIAVGIGVEPCLLEQVHGANLGCWLVFAESPIPEECEAALIEHMASKQPMIRLFIQSLTGNGGWRLEDSCVARRESDNSIAKVQRHLSLHMALFLCGRLFRLSFADTACTVSDLSMSDSSAPDSRRRGTPIASAAAKIALGAVRGLSRRTLGPIRKKPRWQIGVRRVSSENSVSHAMSPVGYSWIEAPQGNYFADPFVVARNGKNYIFAEEYSRTRRLGQIVVMDVHSDGSLGQPTIALQADHHLSYPHVFEYEDRMYMIPESGGHGTVDLYVAEGVPANWRLVRTLFEAPAYDTTCFQHEGICWFFTSIIPKGIDIPALFLFYSTSLGSEWTLHPASPITSDIRHSRCAGPIVSIGGRLFRPTQDALLGYGSAVRLRAINNLSKTVYSEGVSFPDESLTIDGYVGAHTYSRSCYFEAIDRRLY